MTFYAADSLAVLGLAAVMQGVKKMLGHWRDDVDVKMPYFETVISKPAPGTRTAKLK